VKRAVDCLVERISDRLGIGYLIQRLDVDYSRRCGPHRASEIASSNLLCSYDRLQVIFGLGSGAPQLRIHPVASRGHELTAPPLLVVLFAR
jgi:hypothetical protein